MSLLPERGESDTEEDFNWDDYLRETKSSAAPTNCFQQSPTPPDNKFVEGMKLEASDPRFPNINCAATVIAKFGPKIRLRMVGAGTNDDIWTLVDSRQIHPIGYTESQGQFLSPPFNCQRDSLRWGNVLKNMIKDGNLAPADCFVAEPLRPQANLFQVGQKLEACDLKDTTFVCPATIVEVKGDRVRIEFDGWNSSDWVKYHSREIFPIGWWAKAGVIINPPPKKRTKKSNLISPQTTNVVNQNFVNLFDSAKSYLTPPPPSATPDSETSTQKQEERTNSPVSSTSETSQPPHEHRPAKVHPHRQGLPRHTARKSIAHVVAFQTDSSASASPTIVTSTDGKHTRIVDNSVVSPKSASIPPMTAVPPIVIKTNSSNGSPSLMPKRKATSPVTKSGRNNDALQPSDLIIPEDDTSESLTVYLNSSCASGKWLDTTKLQSSNTRFGPGTINHVMRSCLQLLIDCASDPGYVYLVVPSGDGQASVSADLNGSMRIRQLPVFRSAFDGWKCLAAVLDKLQTCPHLLSRQLGDCLSCRPTTPGSKKAKVLPNNSSEILPIDISRKRHGSGESNSSTCTERETGAIFSNEDIQKWNVDEVWRFICSTTDSSSADLFKKQEIDGKALLLLTADMMIRYMNVRLGPALKIANAVEKLKISSKPVVGDH